MEQGSFPFTVFTCIHFPFSGPELSEMVYCVVVLRKGTLGVTTAVTHPLHDRTGPQEAGPHHLMLRFLIYT